MKSVVRLRKTNIWTKVRTKPVRQALNLTRGLIWASSIRDGKRFVSNMIHNEESKVQRLGCPLIWSRKPNLVRQEIALINSILKYVMDTNQVGKITELEVLSYIIKKGYSVSIPFGDKDRYDQIWDIAGKILRVQVKTCKWLDEEHSAIEFACYTVCNRVKHTYTKADIDVFATICDGQLYVVPVEECSVTKKLRFKSNQPNQPNINWAKNYTFEEVIKRI